MTFALPWTSTGFLLIPKRRWDPHMSPVYYALSHFLTLLRGFWYVLAASFLTFI